MPTFTLPDPYDGWPVDKLKDRCRSLCLEVDRWQHMAMAMSGAPGSREKLHPDDRIKLDRLIEAYRD